MNKNKKQWVVAPFPKFDQIIKNKSKNMS